MRKNNFNKNIFSFYLTYKKNPKHIKKILTEELIEIHIPTIIVGEILMHLSQ